MLLPDGMNDLVFRAVTEPHTLSLGDVARLRATGQIAYLSTLAANWESHSAGEEWLRKWIGFRIWE
jgi:hypothetical protein